MEPGKPQKPSAPSGPHRHLIGGEYDGRRHEAGDKVAQNTPPAKLREWLRAGVIEPEKRSEKRSEGEST